MTPRPRPSKQVLRKLNAGAGLWACRSALEETAYPTGLPRVNLQILAPRLPAKARKAEWMGQLVGRCLAWPQPNTTDNSTQCIDTQAGPLGPSPALASPPEKGCRGSLWGRWRGHLSGLENSLKEHPLSQMHLRHCSGQPQEAPSSGSSGDKATLGRGTGSMSFPPPPGPSGQ